MCVIIYWLYMAKPSSILYTALCWKHDRLLDGIKYLYLFRIYLTWMAPMSVWQAEFCRVHFLIYISQNVTLIYKPRTSVMFKRSYIIISTLELGNEVIAIKIAVVHNPIRKTKIIYIYIWNWQLNGKCMLSSIYSHYYPIPNSSVATYICVPVVSLGTTSELVVYVSELS